MPARLSTATLLVLFFAATAAARMPPTQDPNAAAFTATDIVIVSPGDSPTFKVERNFRGNLTAGSKIDLPKFELLIWPKMFGDPVRQPLTKDTRILLFLLPDAKNTAAFEITDYGHAFFFRDVAKVAELETLAKDAIAQHSKWKDARDLPDPDVRIRALFPYLLRGASSGGRQTLEELAKLNPASGDYLASQLSKVPLRDCAGLLLEIRQLQSPKSHAAAIAAIDQACTRFKIYLSTHDLEKFDITAHWNDTDDVAKDAVRNDYGIIYYGLAAVNSFKDPADAPYFRSLVPFLLANGFRQPIEECVFAMKRHPSPENVPLLMSIWEDHKAHHYSRNAEPALPIHLSEAMSRQNDFAVLPALFEMLDIPHWHDSALEGLRDLTKQNFPTDAEWKAWYANQPKLKPAKKAESKTP